MEQAYVGINGQKGLIPLFAYMLWIDSSRKRLTLLYNYSTAKNSSRVDNGYTSFGVHCHLEICTYSDATIFLLDNNNWCCPITGSSSPLQPATVLPDPSVQKV